MAISVQPGSADYPRDQWYVAAFSHEVQPGQLLHRTLCDDPVVLYRTADGTPAALFDRCPHRGMPLSMGKLVVGDRIQCAYHGFEFETSGACKLIPSQDSVPSQMAVHSYPVVERWQWIWFWPGDPAKADPALIPDHASLGLDGDGWISVPGILLPVQANYLLPYENLADATHISYLHHGLIDDGSAASYPFVLDQDGNRIWITREIQNERQGDVLIKTFGWPPGIVLDRTLRIETRPPQTCLIANEFRAAAGGPAFPTVNNNLIAMLTPETGRSTLQFVALAFKGAAPPNVPREVQQEQLRRLLMEDVVAIEAIQKLSDSLPAEKLPEYSQKADAAGLRARRIIHGMIQRERGLAA